MHFIEAIKLAIESIHSHKLRSFLTLLGVIFGVATVIVVVSLIEGFNKYVDEKIANIGTNAFSVQQFAIEDFASLDALNEARKHNKEIRMEDLEALRARVGQGVIKDVGAQEETMCELKSGKETLIGVSLQAITGNIIEIQNKEIAEGRPFSQAEELSARPVCFVGADVADRFFPTRSAIGQTIKIDGRPFEIVGIAKSLGSVFGVSRDKFVSIPMSTFLNVYGGRRSFQLLVASTSPATYEAAVDEARVAMRTRRKLAPNEKDNFGIITPSAVNNLRDKIFGTIQVVAVGVTSIALVVGGIVIMNIMLVTVTERTREIGIRKSLGARRKDILMQFLIESTTLSLVGGAIGLGLAYVISWLLVKFSPIPAELPIWAAFLAIGVSSGVGIIFGLYPAWKAAKLDPIVALRAE